LLKRPNIRGWAPATAGKKDTQEGGSTQHRQGVVCGRMGETNGGEDAAEDTKRRGIGGDGRQTEC
jgi:hypothetical protein